MAAAADTETQNLPKGIPEVYFMVVWFEMTPLHREIVQLKGKFI